MKWTKASERLPEKKGRFIARWPTLTGEWIIEQPVFNPKYEDIKERWISFEYEWLDESESPSPALSSPTTASLDELEKLVEKEQKRFASSRTMQYRLAGFVQCWQFLRSHLSALLAEKDEEYANLNKVVNRSLDTSENAIEKIGQLEERIKEEAIGFAEWPSQNGYFKRTGKSEWFWLDDIGKIPTIYSTQDLYDKYLQSLSTKPSTENK